MAYADEELFDRFPFTEVFEAGIPGNLLPLELGIDVVDADQQVLTSWSVVLEDHGEPPGA